MKEEPPTPDEWEDAARAGSEARDQVAPGASADRPTNASISADLVQAVIDAAREGLPNEACGLLVGRTYAADGGTSERYVALTNAAASPYRYLIDPQEQLRVWLELEDTGEAVWAIVHSHVASAAEPSATDIGLAFFPDSLYVICSLADEKPTLRGWSIRDGTVTEVQLAVTTSEE